MWPTSRLGISGTLYGRKSKGGWFVLDLYTDAWGYYSASYLMIVKNHSAALPLRQVLIIP